MIKVMIDRDTSDSDTMGPYLLELRAAAMQSPGYVSGETLVNLDDPNNVITISTWRSLEDWRTWERSTERQQIYGKIGPVTERTVIRKFHVAAID